MQGVQVDIFGQRLQVYSQSQLNMLSLSACPIGLQLPSLGSHTNAGCSLLEVYHVRFQMAEYAVCASAFVLHLHPQFQTIAPHFSSI